MANKIMGIILILFSFVLGFAFYEAIFRHGWNEGLSRLDNIKFEQAIWGIGAIFAFFVGLSALFKRKKPPAKLLQ